MPIPNPIADETEQEFISRCMGDETMNSEYESEQRISICSVAWNEKNVKNMSKYEIKSGHEIKDMDGTKREVAVYLAKFGNVDCDCTRRLVNSSLLRVVLLAIINSP